MKQLIVHVNRWPAERRFAPGHIIHAAHRPLLGHTTWEGCNLGWGVHFAALTNSGKWPEAEWIANNEAMDAREVVLVDNLQSLKLAEERCREKGREEYGLAAYIRAYDTTEEAARAFVASYELPWEDFDNTANAYLAAQ